MNVEKARPALFVLLALSCLSGYVSPPMALALGLVLALTVGQPWPELGRKGSKYLLQWSVVALGFGMNLGQVWVAGKEGFWFAACTILATLALGLLLGKLFRVETTTSQLVSSGTAICGGSAIAAVGAALKADKHSMSVALATVFVLNAIALFVFPPLGKLLAMSQQQFGMWAAIAIHDTSSVVGAAAKYGDQALELATTVKLTRALWIIPLALGFSWWKHGKGKVTIPWFIVCFVLAAAARSVLPQGDMVFGWFQHAGKLGLTLTLFLIGAGLSRDAVRKAGFRPMLQGATLWVVVSAVSLLVVRALIK